MRPQPGQTRDDPRRPLAKTRLSARSFRPPVSQQSLFTTETQRTRRKGTSYPQITLMNTYFFCRGDPSLPSTSIEGGRPSFILTFPGGESFESLCPLFTVNPPRAFPHHMMCAFPAVMATSPQATSYPTKDRDACDALDTFFMYLYKNLHYRQAPSLLLSFPRSLPSTPIGGHEERENRKKKALSLFYLCLSALVVKCCFLCVQRQSRICGNVAAFL